MTLRFSPEVEQHLPGIAFAHSIRELLVRAIVQVESAGKPWAYRPEPHYSYLWDVLKNQPFRPLTVAERAAEIAPLDFPYLGASRAAEWWGQQASFGLMQVMGAVARERGFRGEYLTELCNPAVGLDIGCAHLAHLLRWADGDEDKAVAAYNAGGGWRGLQGQAYVRKVRAAMEAD